MEFKPSTILKGFAMGIAEVIPGVSGGTIAFISGIYEDLLSSIKAFDFTFFSLLTQGKWVEAWKKVNGPFLLLLGSGMALGILLGILVVTYFLEYYPEPLWGFFFGLVLASAWMLKKEILQYNLVNIFALIVGIGIAVSISLLSPVDSSTNLFYIFLCGMIAISAFILPGVSGSFMLLLLGTYTVVIPSLKRVITDQDMASFVIVTVFALGCLVGIIGFSRVLSWLFAKYRSMTFTLLTGFLIGSLFKIWPWRNVSLVVDKTSGTSIPISNQSDWNILNHENIKILSEAHVLPSGYWMQDPKIALTIISCIIGYVTVYYIEKNSKNPNHQ
ncbi:MAG: DUF368 domain-containing protein [Saprospiraceae bacterium]